MGFPRDFIDEVRRSVDPLRVIGEAVSLKKRGSRWVGLCPFHREKSPSFNVNEEGLWHCFGCGVGGDLIDFVKEYEAVGFQDAVRSLAERAGLRVPEQQRPSRGGGTPESRVDRRRILEALAAADRFYRRRLAADDGALARAFLADRGFDGPVVERFGLGFAPDSWEALGSHMKGEGFRDSELEAAGLVKRRDGGSGCYDRLRRRVVFPIRDLRGRTIAFGGRVIDRGEPKYLNSPETPVFHKSRTLYGLAEGRSAIDERGFVLLVEGYFDLLACAAHGHGNAVAPLGTSFTEEHARLLGRFARKVVVSFDGDEAGLAAAERTAGLFLGQGFQVNVIRLPTDEDPDSFLQQRGPDQYGELLRRSRSALDFLVERLGERADLRSPHGKAEALASLLEFVVPIDDVVERAEWIGRLAERLDVPAHLVEQAAGEVMRKAGGRPAGAPCDRGGSRDEWRRMMAAAPPAERDLLRAVLEHPEWISELLELCGLDDLRDTRVRALVEAAAACREAGESPEPAHVLARCDTDGAGALLSRLRLGETGSIDRAAARNCALGIRDDSLRRRLRELGKEIEAARAAGNAARLNELNAEKLRLARQLPEVAGTAAPG